MMTELYFLNLLGYYSVALLNDIAINDDYQLIISNGAADITESNFRRCFCGSDAGRRLWDRYSQESSSERLFDLILMISVACDLLGYYESKRQRKMRER